MIDPAAPIGVSVYSSLAAPLGLLCRPHFLRVAVEAWRRRNNLWRRRRRRWQRELWRIKRLIGVDGTNIFISIDEANIRSRRAVVIRAHLRYLHVKAQVAARKGSFLVDAGHSAHCGHVHTLIVCAIIAQHRLLVDQSAVAGCSPVSCHIGHLGESHARKEDAALVDAVIAAAHALARERGGARIAVVLRGGLAPGLAIGAQLWRRAARGDGFFGVPQAPLHSVGAGKRDNRVV